MAMNHFVLYRKILETIWSYGLFREPNGYHGYQPEKSIDLRSGVCLPCQFMQLCVAAVTLLEAVSPLVRVAA